MRNRNPMARFIFAVAVVVIFLIVRGRHRNSSSSITPPQTSKPPSTSPSAIAEIFPLVRGPENVVRRDGIVAAILIDTSGSMSQRPANDPQGNQKIETARRCVVSVIRKMEQFSKEQPGRPVMVGVYEFSVRSGQPVCREVTGMGKPNPDWANRAVQNIRAGGDTPIGDSIIFAKQQLDTMRLSREHILVITDGENTAGHTPGDVACALLQLPEEERPGLYFVAFDVAASVFAPAKAAGAAILPASNEKELQSALDELVGNKILIEQ
jgi:hypothetical protein